MKKVLFPGQNAADALGLELRIGRVLHLVVGDRAGTGADGMSMAEKPLERLYAAGLGVSGGHADRFRRSNGPVTIIFGLIKKNPCKKNMVWAVQSLHKESYGRRHANYVQRLWAGIYLQLCRSAVLSGTRLLDTKALQALPPGKEGRSRGIRPPFGSFTGNTCDLFGLWPAYYRSF